MPQLVRLSGPGVRVPASMSVKSGFFPSFFFFFSFALGGRGWRVSQRESCGWMDRHRPSPRRIVIAVPAAGSSRPTDVLLSVANVLRDCPWGAGESPPGRWDPLQHPKRHGPRGHCIDGIRFPLPFRAGKSTAPEGSQSAEARRRKEENTNIANTPSPPSLSSPQH